MNYFNVFLFFQKVKSLLCRFGLHQQHRRGEDAARSLNAGSAYAAGSRAGARTPAGTNAAANADADAVTFAGPAGIRPEDAGRGAPVLDIYHRHDRFVRRQDGRYMGFRSKISYGQVNPNKKFAGYSVNRPYLSFPPDFGGMPENLIQFLKNKYGLSSCSIRSFWFCLDLGYSAEQIIDGFNFSPDSLDLSLDIADWKPPFQDENYLVFCMEAAYGKTRDA